MKRVSKWLPVVLLVLVAISVNAEPQTGTIVFHLTGFHSDAGRVRLALFAGPEGFPSDHTHAVRQLDATITGGMATVTFENVPYGEYALSAFHDEDGNGEMKTGLFGIPKEGLAISNNAKGQMRPPKYKDAKFRLNGPKVTQTLKLKYL
jgi:uncharacterized protein (DUF2141 family)